MIFNEIKCHVNTSLGLVGGCIPCIPPVSVPGWRCYKQNFFAARIYPPLQKIKMPLTLLKLTSKITAYIGILASAYAPIEHHPW